MPNTPRVDRRHLQQIIAGLTEGIVLIDPDRSIAWANETALAIHEAAEPADLGATVDEYRKRFVLRYRNHHRLRPGQYPAERVLAGETFRDVVVEVAKPCAPDFHAVHQVRSLILADAAGEPESLVLVIKDVTERFGAEERFEKTFNANPAPALICRLSDLRYVKVNQGFLDMTGHPREAVVDRSAYEVDVLEDAENREEAIAALNEGRTIAQREATLRLPGGGSKFVIVAGQPIEMGEEACMLFTFIDLEPRKQAELALRHSEERFSKTFRLAPVPMTVSSLEGFRLLEVNEAFTAATGYARDDVVEQNAASLALWEDPAAYRAMAAELETRGSLRNHEIRLRTREGAVLDCLASADTVTIQGQPCILGVLQDITERKRSETELVAALEAVMQDTSWFSRSVIEKLAQIRQPGDRPGRSAELADLTAREREVLGLMCQGHGDADIAGALHLSRHTVRNHVATIYSKIGVHRRAAAVVWARERGVLGYERPGRHGRRRR